MVRLGRKLRTGSRRTTKTMRLRPAPMIATPSAPADTLAKVLLDSSVEVSDDKISAGAPAVITSVLIVSWCSPAPPFSRR